MPEVDEAEVRRLNKQRIEKMKEMDKNERKDLIESAQIHIVVATLLMTITFAAGFTLPGGFESDPNSSNKGMAILISKSTFRAFVVSNAIAFGCSSGAILCYFLVGIMQQHRSPVSLVIMRKLNGIAVNLLSSAMSVVVIAFVTGMYAALAHSVGLAVTVCALGCISFLVHLLVFFSTT
ncbi:protein ACCELERATED CELL DEATH 6-like [Lycium ferocissimum]|uniref:protein ACCELERATED CELL DEATH 6-like n=1 Tax=Lycium ferocissimum TaxID=112874 RepID=UPI0028165CC0|nr:protein ACCELERATED CELL DEATH 6-like [Lycium ferocissimum]